MIFFTQQHLVENGEKQTKYNISVFSTPLVEEVYKAISNC